MSTGAQRRAGPTGEPCPPGSSPVSRVRDPDQRFLQDERLKKRQQFLAGQRGGRKLHLRDMLVFVRPAPGHLRLGITVTKKVGNAVVRNRIKRLVREVWRRERGRLPEGYDLVFVAKASARRLSFAGFRRQFKQLGRRLGGG